MQSVHAAAAGIKSQQARMDVIAANIANINTAGYKSSRVNFKDALYNTMSSPVGSALEKNLLRGSGMTIGSTASDFSDGSLTATGNLLDFAIRGSGFFTVENASGERLYTRNGNFSVSVENDENYLVTSDGSYVLDANGEKIILPDDLGSIIVTGDGTLQNREGNTVTLGIATFVNPDGLAAAGESCYRVTEASGNPQTDEESTVLQGSLENSNVDISQEMTLMIRTQRVYSLISKALQTADDMDGLANTMHR